MTPDMQLAFELLLLGMLSVFLILALVVLSARLLIFAVNRWSSPSLRSGSSADRFIPSKTETISPEILAVLTTSVEVATQGKGRLLQVESVKS